jgi:ubiquinol-cytochrome c reductase cytochrome b subunit
LLLALQPRWILRWILPLLGRFERPMPLPESISRAVLGAKALGGGPLPAGAAAKPMEKA